MKYGNDIPLSNLSTLITDGAADVSACLRDGHLDTAFQVSLRLQDKLTSLQERLNDIKYGRAK